MPLTDPIREPLIEELESLNPGIAPTKPPYLPGIQTNKPFLYQTSGESSNSDQPNLIEPASQPKDEFSLAKADAFIINKANDINSIPEATTSAPKTNSNPRDATTSEIDPLIGKLDSDLGDPLTNPNPNASPIVTTSTTSEKASPKTPLPATAETSSKPEEHKISLSSETTLKSDSEPNKTSPATVSTVIPEHSTTSSIVEKANSDEQSRTAEVSDKIDSDKKAPIAPTSETKNSDKQLPIVEATTLIESDKKFPTIDATPIEKPTSNFQQPTTQPPTAPLIRATSNPVSPDTNISAEVKSTDLQKPVQTPTQSLTDKPNDSQKVDPLKTEPAAIPKTAASENVAVTTAIAAVKTPESSPNNTDSVSEIKQPVKTESIVSQSVGSELIKKTDTTATTSISQSPAEADYAVTDGASQPPAETQSISAPISEHSPVKIDSLPEAADTVEHNIPIAEITAELETEQFPTKTDSLAPAEFTAGTIELDITVAFTAEVETDQTPAITINSLESDSLTSNSNQHIQTDNSIPALFSNPSETTAGTAQIASVETSVSPSTLKSPPSQTSNNYNRNSTPTETATAQPAYSDTEIAPQRADITSGLLPLEAEKSALFSDDIAEFQPNSTQGAGNFQSNINPPTFLSITTTDNLPIPGTFLVDNQGKVRFDYVFDGGSFEGELGIFSLAGMSAFTPGTPEFIAEASRRVLSNSTDGHIVISDSTESAKFTGAMPFDGDWGSGEYQGIKTFNMTPGDTFAVMLVPNATIQSSLQSSYSGNWFPENRPLFSISTANPNDTSYVLPIADATGTGNTFAMEDMSAANSDGDYNDLIFTVLGATGNAPLLDAVINPDREWRNTTLGQQLIEYANSQVPPETAPPAIVAALVNDTGSNSADGITNNPAISGTITDASDIASFRASFSRESTGIELKDLLTDGSFALTPNALSTVNGNTLTDGTYTLYLLAADSHGNTSTFELPFTLDTTPPKLTFGLNPAFDTPPIGDGQTLDSTVTLTGQTDPGSTVILAETGAITTADSTGRFEFTGVTLAIGSNSFTATATDFAGNSSTASRTFTRTATADSDIVWLAEETSFTEKLERPITIPAMPSTLSVNITGLSFDRADSDSIKDAFEIALVDASGRSLVHTLGTGLNSFFNFTEGQPPQLAAGVTFNGSNISVNLSQIAPGTTATLQIRLVNNDSDTATQVGITSIAIQPSAAITAPAIASPSEGASPNAPVNFARLQDVGSLLFAEYKQTSFNSSSKILYADLAVKNTGQYPVRGTLLVGINNISDPTVRLLDADGITPEGIPYYDISKLVIGGILKPGELTSTDTLKFYNPQGVQFSYDLVFLSQLNQVPQFKAAPDTEALVGKSYVYSAIAVDADGDVLTYSLLEKPLGMEIDSLTGIISWNPVAGDIGNHAVTVQVEDGKGGVAKQKYALSAINPPPNRPPIFTSTPVVDAAVNTPYRYDADAKDPDSDTLTYNLVLGPEGMRVNPETGVVQWTPPAAMVFGDTVLGRIGSLGEQDTYTFSALEGQRIYYDSLRGIAGQTLKLYSPSGLLVLDSNALYQGPPINLTETGNYRLVIDGTPGDYGFSLIDMEQTPVAPFDKNVTGLLSPGTEDDAYRFNGFKGQRLYFDQLSGNSTNGNWILYDGEGRQVSSWVDGKQVGPWYVGWQDNEIVLPSDSEYTLVLRGSAPFFGSTSYTFRIVTPDTITYPLQLGSNANPNTVSAAITEKGEQDIYTFGGTKGQRLYFDYLSSSNQVNASVKLISPSGFIVPGFNIGLGSDTEPFTIDETGTYRLEIDGQWESTGNYSFNLLDVGQATPINLDADVTGQLSPGFETHFYSFTGDASQRLYLDSDINPGWGNWTLYGPGNQAIATDSKTTFGGSNTYAGYNPSGLGGDFEVVLPSAGSYLLAVQGRNATPVDYKFRVITPQTLSGGTLTPDTGGNFSVSGSISEKGERDVYTFTGSANQRLLLDALVETPNTYVRLVSPSGIEVFNTPASGDSGRNIPYILPEAGNYRLIVDGYIESTENYNFRLLSLTTAPTLNLNAPTSGTLSPGSETDIYQFTGTEGDRLYLDTLLSSSPGGWRLYGPGNQLVSDNPLWSDIETVLPGSGTYYIVLRGDGAPAPGGNGIAAPISYSIQPFFSTANPTLLTLGSVNNASISKPGEQDVYTFTGSVGQRMYFDPRSGSSSITAKIISPSGIEIFSGNTGADGLSNTLTESGTYRLTIDGDNNVVGSYSFRLANATAAPILPLGTATPGSLPPNEAVLYQISGTAGERILFDSLSPAVSGANWALHAPGFPNFWSQIGVSSLSSDFEVLLPITGAYTLALQNASSSNVSYNISANNITPPLVAKSGLGIALRGNVLPTTPVNQTFTASAGTLVYFDSLDTDGDAVSVTLFNQSGSVVSALNGSNASWDSSSPIQLQQTGTYTLRVQGTGDYGYSLLDLGASQTLILNTTASIPSIPPWGTAAYKFEGAVGQKVYYDGLTNNPGVRLKLISPSGREIDSFTAAEYWSNVTADKLNTLTESGTHYLLVSNDQATPTANVNFRLLDRTIATPLVLNADVESTFAPSPFETDLYRFNGQAGQYLYFDALDSSWPNTWTLYGPGGQTVNRTHALSDFELALPGDGEYLLALQGLGGSPASYKFRVVTPTMPVASLPIGIPTPPNSTIGVPGEQDIYTFNGTAGQRLYFDGIADSGSKNVRLLSPSGVEVFPNISTSWNRDLFSLLETGTYRAVVDTPTTTYIPDTTKTGAYSFRFLDASTATPITLDAPAQTWAVAANETRLLQFTGTAGQNLYFLNDGSNWTLYGPGNSILRPNGAGDAELILPTNGTYTVALVNPHNSSVNYPFQAVTSERTTAPIQLGNVVTGSIGKMGELDTYTFTGEVGQQLVVDSLVANNPSLRTKIFSPSGKKIYEQQTTAEQSPITLEEAGAYRVEIDGDWRSTGNYSFRLLDTASTNHPSVFNLPLDQNLSGTLANAQERQVYRFQGTEGQHLYFDLAGNWNPSNGTKWELYGPGNQKIDSISGVPGPDLEVKLPGNGTYTLVIGGNTNVTAPESYQFKVVTPETTVSPLTLSSSVTSSISEPGERDIYKFNGKPGQRLFFDRITGDSNFTVKLFSPSHPTDTVLNDPNSSSINDYWGRIVPTWSGRLDADISAPMFLQEAGEYHLVIDGTDNTTGNYGFRLVDVEDPQAVPLLNLDADISNTLAPGTEIDFYQFKPALGQPLYFDLAASTGSGVRWVLYGPDNKPIPTAGWTGSDFEITPTIPGTYVLALQNNSATSANYSFKVATPPIATPTALELGSTVSGTIGEPGERNEYTFVGTPGGRVYFDSQGASSGIRAKLISPSGAEFTSNTWNAASPTGNWIAANADWTPATLTELGTYRLIVDGDNSATGSYSFRLQDVAAATLLPVATPTPSRLEPGNETELYKFTGKAGQRLNFDAAVPFGSSASWIVYGPNNQVVPQTGVSGSDFNLMLPTNGEYVLAVRGNSATPVDYNFTVTDSTPTPVATTGLGTVQSGNIAAGQIVNHTFTASAGTRIYFDSQDVDNDPVNVRLLDRNGTQVFWINASSDSNPTVVQLQQTGTYTVEVQGSNPTSTGDYRYQILELPGVTPDPRDNENSIQMGVTVSKTLDPGRSAEVYSFTGLAGQTIFYDGMIPSGGAESVAARLFSPSGDTIFDNDGYWRASSTGDAGPYTLSESGTYNLLLTGKQDSPADYRFRVLDFADAQELELNKRVSATLESVQPIHLYKFTGTAGQRVFFDSISGGWSNNWILYQPGHQNSSPRTVGINNIATDFEALLPVDGEYVLAVIGDSTTASAYSFQTLSGKSVPAVVTPGDGETSGAIGQELGTYRVVLETNDGKGGVAQQDFQVRVVPEPGNSSPTFNTSAVTSGYTSGRYVYDTDASDADGDTLTYLLEDAPSGAIIDSETGRIIWATPVEGTHKVRVRVEDGRGNADIQSFDLSISSVVPGTVKGSVYLDADGTGDRRVTNPGNMTPDNRVVVGPRFKDNYAAYNLNRPDGVPGILGAMAFKRNPDGTVDPNTLLLGGGAASGGGALYEVKVVRGENGHIIGLDDDGEAETPYTANYFADSPYSDAGLVYTPDNVLLANLWKPTGIYSIKPGGAPSGGYPAAMGGLTFVPEGFPGEGQLKATGAYPNNGFYTLTYTRNGNFPDGTPRYIINPPKLETTAGAGPGAFVYMPVTAPNFDSGEGLLMAEWNAGGIYAYDIDNNGNPIPTTRTPFITGYGGAWGAVTDPVTGDSLFNAWAGFSNLMVVRGLGKPTDNEPGMENWLVYVDTNRDGIRNTNEPFTYSDASGNYSFTLAPGNYRIVSQLQPGWTQTSPTNPIYQEVTVTANNTKFGVDFAATNSRLAGPNTDPEFTSTPPTTVKAGERLVYRTTATDLNNDDLTFELVLAPKGMAVAPNGTISWRPPLNAVGIHDVIVRVNDGRGGTDLQAFKIEVTPGNNAPVFTSQLPENTNPAVNQPFQYQAKAVDLDGDTITYSIVPNLSKPVTPTNATINPTTGVVNWTPTTAQQGGAFNWAYAGEVEPWEILIKATDNKGGEAFQRIELTVSPAAPNRPPSITSTPRTNTRLGKTYFYQVEAQDPDGNPLTYTLLNPPSGMAFATPASTPAGMTFQEGLISWTPEVSQQGTYPITVRVSDGLGGLATQTFNLTADNVALNRAPSIDSTPEQITNLAKLYQYNLTGSDADGDRLLWSLDKAPSGMIVDPQSGALRWQPNAEQVGEHTVSVRTIDGNGGYAVQEFTLAVRGINTPPAVVSTPPSKAAVNQVYAYTVVATDLENDPLTFSLNKYPVGMAIDSNGVIQWTPNATQIGQHSVEVAVTDKQGAIATQTFTVTAGTTAINLPPTITSTPVFTASPERPYTYQVTAADADGTISQYQLLQSPPGMTINSATGAITWNNPTAGNHQVVVGAVDNSGTGAAQGFELIARANSAAVVPTIPIQSVSPGASYRYDLKATDANGDLLTFVLIQSPSGMTVDEFGRISWKPTAANIGNHPVEVKVTDTFGESVTLSYNLSVVADTVAPKVSLIASNNTVDVGDYVTFTVNAVDNVKVESLGLTINGTPVVLDAQGQANVKVNNLGNFTAIATAKDAAGNVGNATQTVAAIDPTDVNAPTINISLEDDAEITAPVNITGTISDSNLAYYTLEVAPVGGGQIPGDGGGFKEVYRGTAAVSNGTVATFDPTVLANGAYTLKFTAFDTNGNGSTTERTVNVAGDLKLGNFRLSFTDLSVPVAGIPINVTRTYDSLNANSSDDFGYGWRMEFRDTDLKTSLKADPTYEELGINTVPFDSKTKVFITLPGGKRETFTFKPTPHHLNQYLGGAGPGAMMFKPAFESQKGSTMTLTVKDANLVRNENGYYGVNAQPFNPENPAFGGVYVLTTKEGLVYEIDAKSGDLLTATDANGNKLSFSDAGIKSSTGKSVTFERDAAGRIVSVVDPDGKKVKYEYDAKGDLVAVRDRETNRTQFKYEDAGRPHFLTEVIDPLGRSGVKTEYDESGRLKQMVDANGSAVELVYDPNNSIQKVKDVFGKETTYVYDSRGNVLTEIDPLGKRVDRTFDGDNNVLTETVVTRELNAAGVSVEVKSKTEWTYDVKGNKLTQKDALGNVSRWTYNSRGQVLTETDALGNTATYTYSPSGNLLTAKDAKGGVTRYSYDTRGNILSITDATNNTINFQYNAAGDLTNLQHSSGSEASYIYDSNGNMLRETMKVATPTGEREFVTQWTYNNEGQIESITQEDRTIAYEYEAGRQSASIENNRRSEYRYNSQDKLVETIYPDDTPATNSDNPRTVTLYDKGDRQRATIDRDGRVTHYKYDDAGQLIETIYPNDTANQVQQLLNAISPGTTPQSVDWTTIVYPDATPAYLASNSRTLTEYYKNGRVKAEIDIDGKRTEYEYDAAGRVALTRFDATNYITYTYDTVGNRKTETIFAEGISTTTVYNSEGLVTAVTDVNGKTTQFEYDGKRQLKAVVDAALKRTEYEYDNAGNLSSVKDANNQVTTYEYDDKGRRKTIIRPDNKRSTFVYDDVANTVTITDFNNKTVKYTYNDQNQVIAKQYQNVSGATVSVTYATNGLEETITDSRGATVYKYDSLGQLLSRKDPAGPYLASGNSIEYKYESGQVSEVKTPTRTTNYTYYPEGDYEGRLKTVSTPDMGTVTYVYYPDGNLWKTSYSNNLLETRTYDNFGRLDVVKTAKIDPMTQQELQVISTFDYLVDAVGNRKEVVEQSGRKVEYKYDDLHRLLEEKITNDPNGNNRVVSYTYDAVGNRLTKTDSVSGVTTYTYNNLNQLDFLSASGVVTNYTYDDSGNLVSEVTGSNSTVYRWENDGENRLMGVTVTEGGVTRNVAYQYNAQGIRVGKVVDGVETRYLIDDELQPYSQVLEEYDAAGNPKNSYVYGYDLVGKLQGSQPSFYHADGLGSTRLATNNLGAVTDSYAYDAYGNLIAATGVSSNAYLFAGEQRDSETGLDYLRARYYDPLVGRFVSADAYEGTLNDPMSLHDYQYAHANPVVNTDPSGYMTNMSELLGNMAAYSVLAGLSYTTGAAVATVAGGGSMGDAVAKYDQFFAGLTDALTFGISSNLRELVYGKTATNNHRGIFFNLGRLSGAVASMWVGSKGATLRELSSANWVAKAALGYDIFGAGLGMVQSTLNVAKGKSTWLDILAFLPLATWFAINYKVTRNGLSYGINGGDFNITPRDIRPNSELFSDLIKDKDRVTLELFGGQEGMIPGAINIDIVAKQGIKADILAEKLTFVPDNSVDEIITFNPFIPPEVGGTGIRDYLPEAARVLKPGGTITISGSKNNKYTKITASLLDELGLEVIEKQIPLPERFSQYKFFQVDGITEVPRDRILTTTLRKKG